MILVDTSVWIDYFRGAATPQTEVLDDLLADEPLYTGDLILTEVLQGFRKDNEFQRAKDVLLSLDVIELGGHDVALKAAQNYRTLRKAGVTVRNTMDTIIATRCIEGGFRLLHDDRDFDPFVTHLGLKSVIDRPPARTLNERPA